MAIGLAGKKAIVKEVNDVASNALAVTVAEYRGIEVADMTALRKKAREQGVFLKVVRNTLAKRAFEGTQFEDMSEALKGPLVYGFSLDAPGASARLFKDWTQLLHFRLVMKHWLNCSPPSKHRLANSLKQLTKYLLSSCVRWQQLKTLNKSLVLKPFFVIINPGV